MVSTAAKTKACFSEITDGVRLMANERVSKPRQVQVLPLERTVESFGKSPRLGVGIGRGLRCLRSNSTKQRQRRQCGDDTYFLASLRQPPLSCDLQALDEGRLVPLRLRSAAQPARGRSYKAKSPLV